MCGHWEMTEEQRCANCGEPVVGSELEIAMRPRRSVFNLRTIIGFLVMATFGAAVAWNFREMRDLPEGERSFRTLIGISLSCGSFIGFTLLVQGVFRALRSREAG